MGARNANFKRKKQQSSTTGLAYFNQIKHPLDQWSFHRYGLSPAEEMFCQKYLELGSYTKAYLAAYGTDEVEAKYQTDPGKISSRASAVAKRPKISARINQLASLHLDRHRDTVDTLLEQLDHAYEVALAQEKPQVAAAVGAVMGKAKLLGLDRQVVSRVEESDNASFKSGLRALFGKEEEVSEANIIEVEKVPN